MVPLLLRALGPQCTRTTRLRDPTTGQIFLARSFEMGKRRVLVADDHKIIRGYVRSIFEARGFEVSDAENGAQAVEKAQELHPDLVVLDLSMPVMNGLEAARALKVMMPSLPLLMFTNHIGSVMEDE